MTWVASFYRFRPIDDPDALRATITMACTQASLRGTVLIATEGVNAALAGPRCDLERVIQDHFADMDVNWSRAAPGNPPFRRLKVRVKDEIVTFGQRLAPPLPVGEHVAADVWHELLDDPNVLVLDTRNAYESDVGTFRGAKRTNTATFNDFKAFVRRELDPERDKCIAMFCTGGIRCEKASAHLLAQGFEDVRQLDGGILRYLAETDAEASAFQGECFVFDDRVSVAGDLAQGSYELCRSCGWPVSSERLRSTRFAQDRGCPACRVSSRVSRDSTEVAT